MFLVIPEATCNTKSLYIINIIRIKRNFRFVAAKIIVIKIIIIKIIIIKAAVIAIIRPILFIIKKFIIRYQAQLL